MSEAYLNRVFPAMRSAFPSEWVGGHRKAQKMPVDVYVPGHGFVESPAILKEELETYRKALVQVIAEAKRLHGAKVDVETADLRRSSGTSRRGRCGRAKGRWRFGGSIWSSTGSCRSRRRAAELGRADSRRPSRQYETGFDQ